VIPVPDGFVAVVADVCGKGIPAATASLDGAGDVPRTDQPWSRQRRLAPGGYRILNASVCARTPGEKYVTMAALRYTHLARVRRRLNWSTEDTLRR